MRVYCHALPANLSDTKAMTSACSMHLLPTVADAISWKPYMEVKGICFSQHQDDLTFLLLLGTARPWQLLYTSAHSAHQQSPARTISQGSHCLLWIWCIRCHYCLCHCVCSHSFQPAKCADSLAWGHKLSVLSSSADFVHMRKVKALSCHCPASCQPGTKLLCFVVNLFKSGGHFDGGCSG